MPPLQPLRQSSPHTWRHPSRRSGAPPGAPRSLLPPASDARTRQGAKRWKVWPGRLEASAGANASPLNVTVVDTPAVDARALPGGHILLTAGMIDALRTPDELAGVMAHAIADAQALGPTRALLGALRPGELVTLLQNGAQTPPALLSAALSRTRPTPADLAVTDSAAIALLREAGLRTRGLAGVHDVLASLAAQDGRPPLYLRSHPVDAARTHRLRAVPAGGAQALPWEHWQAVKAICGPLQPPARPGFTG